MATWSASLPSTFLVDGYQEQWPDNLIIQEMEVGPPKVRRRQTAAPEYINCYQILTTAQVATLKTYWTSTLTGGSTTIDPLVHPRSGSNVVARMIRPPVISALGAGKWRVGYVFQVLP